MRVALITDGIWPYVLGGMQKHSYYLCKYLAQNNITVDLFHYNQSSYEIEKLEFFSEQEKQNINSIIVPLPKQFSFPGHYIFESYLYSKTVFKIIEPKLTSYHFLYTKGFSGWYLINQKHNHKISCAKIGVKFHGYEMFQKSPSFKSFIQNILFLRYPVKSISKKADVVFSYGGKITDIIKSIGVASKNIFELPSGVEANFVAEQIIPTNQKIKAVYLGRYERRKGIEELNKAIIYLSQNNLIQNLQFNFIGPIPENKKIKLNTVNYFGEIRDKEELKTQLKNCDVLICPSWSEGMPNVILEAMALGLAVIATDVGATKSLVSSNNGFLIEASNQKKLETSLINLNSISSQKLNTMKESSLNLIKEKFVWDKLIHQLIQFINAK